MGADKKKSKQTRSRKLVDKIYPDSFYETVDAKIIEDDPPKEPEPS